MKIFVKNAVLLAVGVLTLVLSVAISATPVF